jgi:hypothetical protein
MFPVTYSGREPKSFLFHCMQLNLSIQRAYAAARHSYTQAKPQLRATLIFLACTLLLWRLAIHNGYPILYAWDSGSYIGLGQSLQADGRFRLAGYGLFVALSSLGVTLFLSSCIQAACMTCVITLFLRYAMSIRLGLRTMIIFIFLALCTRLSFLSSVIHPDVFTGAIFLAQYIYWQTTDKKHALAMLACLAVLPSMHVSFLAISILTTLLCALICSIPRSKILALCVLHACVIIATIGIRHLQPKITGHIPSARHYFIAGRMAETGLLAEYLAKHCPTTQYAICAHQDELQQIDVTTFVWKGKAWAPNATGENQAEMMRIIQDIVLREPVLLARFLMRNATDAASAWAWALPYTPYQVIDVEINTVRLYYPGDLPYLLASEVNTHPNEFRIGLRYTYLLERIGKFVLLGLLVLLLLCDRIGRVQLPLAKRNAVLGMLALICVNAFVCANGSGIFERYFDRLHWLIFLVFAVCAGDVYRLLKLDRLMSFLHLTNTQKTTRQSVL